MIQVSKTENLLAKYAATTKVATMVVAMAGATACVAECGKDHDCSAAESSASEKPEASADPKASCAPA